MIISPIVADASAQDAKDDADITVDLKQACEVSINEYAVPSAGVIGIGRTGSFFSRIKNIGSFEATVENANISIYRYNRTSNETEYLDLSIQQDLYDEYEPMADYQNYSAELATTGGESFGRYAKAFTAATNYNTGTYNATVSFNYTCYRGPGLEPLNGQVNNTKELSLVDSERTDEAPETPDEVGRSETDQAIPEDYTDDSIVEANATNYTDDAPQEANRTTAGSNPELPGQSAANRLEVQPVNRTNSVERGTDNPIRLRIENTGDRYVPDVTLGPDLQQLDGWSSDEANIDNITAGETLERTINVQPPKDAELGTEIIPVRATSGDVPVDLDYFYADVIRTELNQSLEVVEFPPSVSMNEEGTRDIPVLIRNTGEVELTNINAELENNEGCVTYESSQIDRLAVNESTSVPLSVSAQSVNECDVNMILSSAQSADAFASFSLSVTPEDVLIPERQAPPILAIVWTFVLAFYAVIRKKLDWESITAELPLLLLVMGETVIILYLTVGYFGFIQVPFLPF